MTSYERPYSDDYYKRLIVSRLMLMGHISKVANYMFSRLPDPDYVREFSWKYPLRATMVKLNRAGATRSSRVPMRLGPALTWFIDRAAVPQQRRLRVLTTDGSGAAMEVYALLFASRPFEVTCWFPEACAWRKDLVEALKPNAAEKLKADLAAFLKRFPDETATLDTDGLMAWPLKAGNLIGRFFIEEFHVGRNLDERRFNMSRLLKVVRSADWPGLLTEIHDRAAFWHEIDELDHLKIANGTWDTYEDLVRGIRTAVHGTHSEIPRPDMIFHDAFATPIPPRAMGEILSICGSECRFLAIINGVAALDALREACKAAQAPLHVLQEGEGRRPRSLSTFFLVGNWPFARKRVRSTQNRPFTTSASANPM